MNSRDPDTVTPCAESCPMAPRLETIERRLGELSEQQGQIIGLVGQVLAAQEAEVDDRRTRRTQILHLVEGAGRGIVSLGQAALKPGVILPLSVVAVLLLALVYGASVTYGDLVVEAAAQALDTDAPAVVEP